MGVYTQSLTATDFDGTPSKGDFDFGVTGIDTERVELLSVSVQALVPLSTLIVRAAANQADALPGSGTRFIELLHFENVSGAGRECCRCILPAGFHLFVFTTGNSGVCTSLVDFHAVTLLPKA